MRLRSSLHAAALVAAVLLAAAVTAVALDPYRLVQLEYGRQRLVAGLSADSMRAAGHRWSYAYSDDAPADAPTVVMLHGYTGSKENWYPLARRLHGRYRLLIPDLPGWGASERRDGQDYGYAAQAQRVHAFLQARGVRTPVVLLGHSMGGGIAAVVAARYPDDVRALGLLAASGVRFRDNAFGRDVVAGRNPFGVADQASLSNYLDILFHDPAARPRIPWPASRGFIAHRRHDGAFEQQVLDRIGRGDAALLPGALARRIAQPTLLLWCRQDRVIDPSAAGLYAARIARTRQVLLDGCGHMSLVERPDEVAQAVDALIATAPAAVPAASPPASPHPDRKSP
ncbi:alpha/beta fold hydrolase [Agrilutibacter solisilvae]|uniref:Alpha/beta fold hydrolase n=1 Tax=Agrilutibacter solisilvae TaxID=2763317 RepID=A0A975AT55_9GAMM|nr:alpha/beta fold hydrolase [Lysobacter solisilvae]QSX78759.1 alpha/beta fold hydrolase [Lysobacter solisilvae]